MVCILHLYYSSMPLSITLLPEMFSPAWICLVNSYLFLIPIQENSSLITFNDPFSSHRFSSFFSVRPCRVQILGYILTEKI